MPEIWYKELGFYNNPFSIKPAAYTNEVVGYNLKNLFDKINKGSTVFILGPFGTGKTTILKHVIGKYGGKGRVVYFSCGVERAMDPEKLIRGAGGFFDKLRGGIPEDIIFLVDEANDLFEKDADELYSLFKEGFIKSIVFVGTDVPYRKLPAGLETDLKGNIINLAKLPPSASVTLVRKRVGNLYLLPDSIITEIYRRSKGSTRLMLEYCEELCRMAVSRNLKKISKEEINEVLPTKERAAPKKKKAPARKKNRRPIEEAIEEAVFEVESDAPVVEGLAPIEDGDPLPESDLYKPETKKRSKK